MLYLSWAFEMGMTVESGEKDNNVRSAGTQQKPNVHIQSFHRHRRSTSAVLSTALGPEHVRPTQGGPHLHGVFRLTITGVSSESV